MNELSDQARAALDDGLVLDGPSAEHRMRMKQRVLLALGAGTLTLGGASAVAAEGTAPLLAGGATALAKGVGVSSLLAWFGMGALAGVGVSGAVALGSIPFTPAPQASAPALQASASALAPAHPVTESTLQLPVPAPHTAVSATEPTPAGDLGESTPRRPAAESRSSGSGQARRAETAIESESLTPRQSTLSEEASLLQGAQRALAAKEPALALGILAEHERRFVSGALSEERKAARVLALCSLGRTGEARELARAFVNASPRSLLLLRLEQSCVASSMPNPRERTE